MPDRIGAFGVTYSPTLTVMLDMVHHGHVFTAGATGFGVSNGGFIELAMQVPSNRGAHVNVDASAAKLAELTVHRLSGAVTGGDVVVPQNLNHNVPFTATVAVRSGAWTVFRLTSRAANNDLGLRVRWCEPVR